MPEIVPQLFSPLVYDRNVVAAGEPEILAGRRAFSTAQALLSGSPTGSALQLTCGWYDSTVHPETGSFACVNAAAGLDDLIGEIVQVSYGGRAVFVYVIQAVTGLAATVQFGLARRAFCAISRLSIDDIAASVVVVEG